MRESLQKHLIRAVRNKKQTLRKQKGKTDWGSGLPEPDIIRAAELIGEEFPDITTMSNTPRVINSEYIKGEFPDLTTIFEGVED